MKPIIRKTRFLDVFRSKGMFNQIHLYSNLSRMFFFLSLTPIRHLIPVKYTSYLLIDDGDVVGTGYIIQSGERAELTISIDKKYRRQGLGSAIIIKILEENKNKVEIFLRVHKNNRVALKFFTKLGFKITYQEMIYNA